jgi:hypothetical protein
MILMKMRLLLLVSLCCLPAAVATAADTPAARPQPAEAGKKPATATTSAPRRYTVEELFKNCGDLDNKNVSVRAEAVKVTGNIMGKTWIHLQDGTGDKAKGTDDIIGMSEEGTAQVGESITVTGTLKHNPGNRYNCVIEDATISK